MKKLKKRIKRALAGFLIEELREIITGQHLRHYWRDSVHYRIENVEAETLVLEQVVNLSQISAHAGNIRQSFNPMEFAVEESKKQFAEKVMEHIHVDAQDLLNYGKYRDGKITLRLVVQKKK